MTSPSAGMRTAAWLVIALLLPVRTADADSRWTRLRSDHFEFIGDASERNIRDVALHLEQFREALSRVLPPAAVATTVPTVVFVFQNDASLTPYKPTFEGKPVALAGFFSGWTDRTLIAINASAEQSALRVVFHEYAHFLVQNTSGRLPACPCLPNAPVIITVLSGSECSYRFWGFRGFWWC